MNQLLSEEQQVIYDYIKNQMYFGFYSTEDVYENALEETEVLGYGDEVKPDWIEEQIAHFQSEIDEKATTTNQSEDVSKLIQAFENLAKQNIVALHFPSYDEEGSLEEVEEVELSLKESDVASDGYCFYTGDGIEQALENNELVIHFQKLNNESNSICKEIGSLIKKELENQGLQVDWDGKANHPLVLKNFEWMKKFDEDEKDLLNYNYVIETILLENE